MNISHCLHISASIGITFFPRDASSATDLIRNADLAMYVAKNAGRNCCRFFSQKMQDEVITRIRIMNDLHDASNGATATVFSLHHRDGYGENRQGGSIIEITGGLLLHATSETMENSPRPTCGLHDVPRLTATISVYLNQTILSCRRRFAAHES